jgi:hypothetical protein
MHGHPLSRISWRERTMRRAHRITTGGMSMNMACCSCPVGERLRQAQAKNSSVYLEKWGLSVSQLRGELSLLGFPTSSGSLEFTDDISVVLERFQRHHSMRHRDGIFGELTFLKMYELRRVHDDGSRRQ